MIVDDQFAYLTRINHALYDLSHFTWWKIKYSTTVIIPLDRAAFLTIFVCLSLFAVYSAEMEDEREEEIDEIEIEEAIAEAIDDAVQDHGNDVEHQGIIIAFQTATQSQTRLS